ncbi:MAG: DNA translocase FtsK [Actinobacteria bacterium]|nr:MAG: DNA translocase FtsK [Actinomycetota bacterium]
MGKKIRRKASQASLGAENLHEVYGIAFIVVGLLIAISMLTGESGIVTEYVANALRWTFGVGAYVFPLILIVLGAAFFARRWSLAVERVGLGFAVALVSFIALVHLGAPPGRDFYVSTWLRYGGLLGACFGYVFRFLLGVVGARIALTGLLLIGLVLATDVSIAGIVRAVVGLLRPEPRPLASKPRPAKEAVAERATPHQVPPLEREVDVVRLREPEFIDAEASRKTKQLPLPVTPEPDGVAYQLPPLTLLRKTAPGKSGSRKGAKEQQEILERTLANFDVDASISEAIKGPTVTRFEIRLASGVKVNRIVSLADDIALALAVADIRILAPIPGKSAIGIEVPNEYRELVTLGDVLTSEKATSDPNPLAIAIGKDNAGTPVLADIGDMPHLLIAGATGSGKSVCINAVLMSMLVRAMPDQVKMILIDPKQIELNLFNDLPHLLAPVVKNAKQAPAALAWAVAEMESRFEILGEAGCRNIDGYNAMIAKGGPKADGAEPMPYLLIVIDELADLIMVAAGEVEDAICRLAQLARAVGIHLVVATQRPSADIITGLIKANITTRIAFEVSSQIDSRVILDQPGAEKLVGKGDMLFSSTATPKPRRIQGCMVTEHEIEQVTEFIRRQAKPDYREDILAAKKDKFGYDYDDDLLEKAMEIVVTTGQASVSMLQRRLRVGYSRAARIMDMLEERGVVGPHEGAKPRAILIDEEDLRQIVGTD